MKTSSSPSHNDAKAKVEEAMKEKMKSLTGGLPPSRPQAVLMQSRHVSRAPPCSPKGKGKGSSHGKSGGRA